jgi:inner membrane protein
VGHSLSGYLIYLGAERKLSLRAWKIILLYLVCANLPDLDILPGYLLGRPNLYHHGISHSIGLAVVVGLVAAGAAHWKNRRGAGRVFVIAFGLYFGHVLLDTLIVDTTPPYGVQLFWPLSREYVISPVLIFPTVYKADTSGAFLGSLIHPGNLRLIGVELLYFVPLILLVRRILNRRDRFRNRPVRR